MSDLIDRQAAIDAISCDITVKGSQNAELVAATIATFFVDSIKALPSVQPTIETRKTGHWIVEPNCWLRCSECGEHYPHVSIYETKGFNYCPNCGARMEDDK